MPKWRTILKVVLPTLVAGIITGIMLGVARVIGETAPLLLARRVHPVDQPQPVLRAHGDAAVFPRLLRRPGGVPRQTAIDRAWGTALVLIVIVMILNLAARLVARA